MSLIIHSFSVDGTNNDVEVKFDSSKNIVCSFVNQHVQNISCNITYWLCSKTKMFTNAYGDAIDESTNRIFIPLASSLIDGEYCFTIYAGYDDSIINVDGTFIVCESVQKLANGLLYVYILLS